MALATVEDVAVALGHELSEAKKLRAQFLLDQLSAKFAREARCTFTVETFTHRVKVNGGHARPPRRPLLSVSAVVDDDGQPVPYRLGRGFVSVDLPSDHFVVVTYQAGYQTPPEVVVNQIADSVVRILQIDPGAASGHTQDTVTTGPFSKSSTFAPWAIGAQAMLSPDDIALAHTFRPKRAGNVWVGGTR